MQYFTISFHKLKAVGKEYFKNAVIINVWINIRLAILVVYVLLLIAEFEKAVTVVKFIKVGNIESGILMFFLTNIINVQAGFFVGRKSEISGTVERFYNFHGLQTQRSYDRILFFHIAILKI